MQAPIPNVILKDDIRNMPDLSEIKSVWREVFSRLLMSLVTKSEAPPDSALSRDDQELLRCYRQDISDTVVCIYKKICFIAVDMMSLIK